jgi:2-polyprenyl-3-methyl-5-hydroxy-6-metoxy-1,4-benzoquinol methylase
VSSAQRPPAASGADALPPDIATSPLRNSDATYIIRSGAAAESRLELLARICWPATEQFLHRRSAIRGRVLDVGCGSGDVAMRMIAAGADEAVGIDINAEVVAIAQARTAALGSAATFRLAGIDDVGGADLRDFDVVYSRCVLSHLPDPRAAMAALWRAVTPGGVLMIEDVEVAATWGSPPSAALARYRELYVAAANANGASPAVGAELACFLHDLGATEVEVDLTQPVLRTPEDQMIHAVTMDAIANPVIMRGLASAEEVDGLVRTLTDYAHAPGTVSTLPRIVQVSGRRPVSRGHA